MELTKKEQQELNILCKKLSKIKGIEAVFLFGSYARGTANENSDIDICVIGKLSNQSIRKIKSQLPKKIDFSLFHNLPIWIKTRVFGEGKSLIINDKNKIYDLAFSTMHEWEDFKPFFERLIYKRNRNGQ